MKVLSQALKGIGVLCAAGTAATLLLRAQRKTSFQGQVVFITGGSRGFGLVLAREFAKEGARLAMCARDAEELAHAKTELQSGGTEVHTYVCDITDQVQFEATLDAVMREVGPIDVLVNNAAVLTLGPVETMSRDDFKHELDVSFWAQLTAIQKVAPHMKARRKGRIVNISSVGGRVAVPHMLPYSVAKHANSALSQGMRVELAKDGVLVTTVWPYIMRVGSFFAADMKGQHKKVFAIGNLYNSLPFTSMSGERVARGVVNACRYGLATYNPSYREGFFVLFQALCPNVVAELLSVVPRIMPGPHWEEADPNERKKGFESVTPASISPLTALNDEAAKRNNEPLPPQLQAEG